MERERKIASIGLERSFGFGLVLFGLGAMIYYNITTCLFVCFGERERN
jgi:hypothetical protein